jgi:hypothetical protein
MSAGALRNYKVPAVADRRYKQHEGALNRTPPALHAEHGEIALQAGFEG